jgi:hypothetical protein
MMSPSRRVDSCKVLQDTIARIDRLDGAINGGALKTGTALITWKQSWRYRCDVVYHQALTEVREVIGSLVLVARLN